MEVSVGDGLQILGSKLIKLIDFRRQMAAESQRNHVSTEARSPQLVLYGGGQSSH